MQLQLPEKFPNIRLLDEFAAHETAEEKLAWLMERSSPAARLPDSEMTPEKRIPGCMSGLWLQGVLSNGRVSFFGRSESALVQGVVCFLCDLCSGVPSTDIPIITSALSGGFGLDGLLSTTRKRAIATTLGYIAAYSAKQPRGAE